MDRKNETMARLFLNGNELCFAEIDIICVKIAGLAPSYLAPLFRFDTGDYHLYVDELAREARRCSNVYLYFAVKEYYPSSLHVEDVIRLFFDDIDNYYRRVEGNPIEAHE